jgi:hypothetical protein
MAVSDTVLFACASDWGLGPQVFRSTDLGASWTLSAGWGANCFAVSGASLFAGTLDKGVYRSTDNGGSWTPVNSGLTNYNVSALAVSGKNVFAGTWKGLFRSTDNGENWTSVISDGLVTSLAVSPEKEGRTTVFCAIENFGIFSSPDNGTSWQDANAGLSAVVNDTRLVTSHTYVFANRPWVTPVEVWKRPLSEWTSVSEGKEGVPMSLALEQNYPNPFNPTTAIRYALPQRSHVTLTVFNTLGQQVATLIKGEVEAGYHEVQFYPQGLASGVYVYRLQAGDFVQSKKLLLLK